MFSNLNNIDWSSFGERHIAFACLVKDIPRYIQQLISDNPDERMWAVEWLMGEGQHAGMISRATPAILPFIFEVLALPTYRDKSHLLDKLMYLSDHSLAGSRDIRHKRLELAAYDALMQGVPIFLQLLNSDEVLTRHAVARLLYCCQDHADEVLEAMRQRFFIENHIWVRVVLLGSVGQLLSDAYLQYSPPYKRYIEFLAEVVQSNRALVERFVAAEFLYSTRAHILDAPAQVGYEVRKAFRAAYPDHTEIYSYSWWIWDWTELEFT